VLVGSGSSGGVGIIYTRGIPRGGAPPPALHVVYGSVTYGSVWQCNIGQRSVIYGNVWQHRAGYGDIWQRIVTYGDVWQPSAVLHMAMYGDLNWTQKNRL